MTPRRQTAGGRAAVLLTVLAACCPAACGSRPGSIEGRAVSGGAGVPAMTVEVYLGGDRDSKGAPFATAASAGDGTFRLELPSGRYWVWLKDLAAVEGPRRMAEYAGNPVALSPGERRSLGDVELREVGRAPGATAAPGGGVRGRVLLEGAPVADAVVTVYEGANPRAAGPGYLAMARTDGEGRFEVALDGGAYRVAVRRREKGRSSGFLQAGDFSATLPQDILEVPTGRMLDLGDLVLHRVDPRRLAEEESRGFQAPADTRVEGRAVDRTGRGRAGQFVFAYRDEAMIGRPEAVATTDADGGFSLSLPGGGRYFFGARSRSGGPRQPGEWAGKLAGAADSSLEIPAGRRVRGLRIVMEEAW